MVNEEWGGYLKEYIRKTSDGVCGEWRGVPLKSTGNTGSWVCPHVLAAPALGDMLGEGCAA